MFKDKVFINNLAATAITGSDAWNRPTAQPISITIELDTDFSKASQTDNLKYSLNYAVISRNVLEFMKVNELKNFKSIQNIGEEVGKIVLDESKGGGEQGTITVKSAKSEIRADCIEYKLTRNRSKPLEILDSINVQRLRLLTIIGVFTFERLKRQLVDIDLSIELLPTHNVQIHQIMDEITRYVESSNFKTVEALELTIGQLIFQNHGHHINKVVVTVTKPNAITYTEGVGVQSELNMDRYKNLEKLEIKSSDDSANSNSGFNLPVNEEIDTGKDHIAYIAFGSNEGNQIENINWSVDLLNEHGLLVMATSSMYISKPMYFTEQPDFFNGVLKVQFEDKSPHEVLKILKDIEYKYINRVKEFDNGPRSIDLDLLLFDEITLNTTDLTVPHKSMLDRTFVLQPLCELIRPDFIHPISAEPIHNHLKELLSSSPNESVQESNKLLQFIPVKRLNNDDNPLRFDLTFNKSPTLMMGILNVTPDSFSDGGKNFDVSIEQVLDNCVKLIEDGAKIIDVGGVSTRPGSEEPSEQEELDRVVPIVQAIRSHNDAKLSNCLISVDTYRANVAEQCLKHGADIINDISMGLYEEQIFEVVAKYQCPYIMNHTRGNSKNMSKLTEYEANTNEDIIELLIDPLTGQIPEVSRSPEVSNLINGICREQVLQVLKAYKAGVKKWQIILDPGIGFAKKLNQNLSILANSHFIRYYSAIVNDRQNDRIIENYSSFNSMPLLLGPSRKKFLGVLNNEPNANDRIISTSAAIMACVQQDTNIVRVHDTKEMGKTITIGDAIYRQ